MVSFPIEQAGPPVNGRWVRLEPLTSENVAQALQLVNAAALAHHWPRNQLASEGALLGEEDLWRVGDLSYVARSRAGHPVGLLQGINEDLVNQTIGLSVVIDDSYWKRGWPLEAVVIMLDLLFHWHNYRKVYFQFADSTQRGAALSLAGWWNHEAQFDHHQRTSDGWESWHIFSLFRRQWEETRAKLHPLGSRIIR